MSEKIPSNAPAPEPYEPYRVTPVTRLLIDTTVAVFLLQVTLFYLQGHDVVGEKLSFSAQAWTEHRYWTLLTYAWAHAVALPGAPGFFWLHILVNMIPLFCLGPALEDYLGSWRFLGLYLGGAIAAALVWVAVDYQRGASIVGASGAAFAVIAAAGTAAPRMRVMVFLFFVLPIPMKLRTLALVICGAELVQRVFHWMPEVAHSAHLGGAAFGFLYVLAMRLICLLPKIAD